MIVKTPGIHGFGECVLCGQSFAVSIWLGESISMVAVAGFDSRLPMHPKCSSLFQSLIGQEYTALPEGPLRTEFLASV